MGPIVSRIKNFLFLVKFKKLVFTALLS